MDRKIKKIIGTVVHGQRLWRAYGFPTANITIDPAQYTLDNVVSICQVYFDNQKYPAIGTYLPFKKTYEVHLLDWEWDLYNKEITVCILETIRENKKFDSQEGLKQQIQRDREYAKNRWMLKEILQKNHDHANDDKDTEGIIGI